MVHRIVFAALPIVAGLVTAPHCHAQSAASRPAFEVASIKLVTNCSASRPPRTSPGRLNICFSLRALILGAYGGFVGQQMNPRLLYLKVLGGPAWLDSDRYEISAKAEGNASLAQMMGPMLQTLLEERFKVKVHMEARETPVYALTLANDHPKLQPFKEGSCTPMDLNDPPNLKPGDAKPRYCGGGQSRQNGETVVRDWYGLTMEEFAGQAFYAYVDRPVVDRTGLTERYDVHLEFARGEFGTRTSGPVYLNGELSPDALSGTPGADSSGPSIFTALRQQLGLKLVPDKSPLQAIVVDHAEKPSEN